MLIAYNEHFTVWFDWITFSIIWICIIMITTIFFFLHNHAHSFSRFHQMQNIVLPWHKTIQMWEWSVNYQPGLISLPFHVSLAIPVNVNWFLSMMNWLLWLVMETWVLHLKKKNGNPKLMAIWSVECRLWRGSIASSTLCDHKFGLQHNCAQRSEEIFGSCRFSRCDAIRFFSFP